METIFMNTENSRTNEPHRFRSSVVDLNLKYPNENMALASLSIYYAWKIIKSATTINLKFLLQLGMMYLLCLIDLLLLQTSKTTLNLLSKNMKL